MFSQAASKDEDATMAPVRKYALLVRKSTPPVAQADEEKAAHIPECDTDDESDPEDLSFSDDDDDYVR